MRTTTKARNRIAMVWAIAGSLAAADPLPWSSPPSAGFDPLRLERLHQFGRRLVDEKMYSGLTTLVVRDGKIVDWQVFGMRSVGVPLQRDDTFAIASLTKIITTVGALMLVEEGRLSLNEPIAQFLPEFAEPKLSVVPPAPARAPTFAAARPITLEHLLTHTAGLSDSTPLLRRDSSPPRPSGADFVTLAERVHDLAQHALLHQPGEAWVYGPATDVVGRLIEVVSGQPFDSFLRARILVPLKMGHTTFEVPETQRARQVTMDVRQPDGTLRSETPKTRQHPWPSGAGGLFSTPGDYVRFAQMLLNGGELEGVRVLSPKMVALMTQDHLHGLSKPTKIYPVSDGFGLGVEVRTDVAKSGWLGSLGTYGWNGATTAYCSLDPQERLIAMVWAQHQPNAEFQLYERFNNLVYQALLR